MVVFFYHHSFITVYVISTTQPHTTFFTQPNANVSKESYTQDQPNQKSTRAAWFVAKRRCLLSSPLAISCLISTSPPYQQEIPKTISMDNFIVDKNCNINDQTNNSSKKQILKSTSTSCFIVLPQDHQEQRVWVPWKNWHSGIIIHLVNVDKDWQRVTKYINNREFDKIKRERCLNIYLWC